MGKTKKKYYVVWAGREPGVYDDWDDAREQIEGSPAHATRASSRLRPPRRLSASEATPSRAASARC